MFIGILLIGRNFNVHLTGGGLPNCGDPIHVSSSRSKDSISFIAKVSPSPFHISQIYFVSLTNLSHTLKRFFLTINIYIDLLLVLLKVDIFALSQPAHYLVFMLS